jgi:hypothetical protein
VAERRSIEHRDIEEDVYKNEVVVQKGAWARKKHTFLTILKPGP